MCKIWECALFCLLLVMGAVGCQPGGDTSLPVKLPETQPITVTGVLTETTPTSTTSTYTEPPICDGAKPGLGAYQWLDHENSEDFVIGNTGCSTASAFQAKA